MIGSCDICDAQNVEVARCDSYGIETYACAKCRGEKEPEPELNANLAEPFRSILAGVLHRF